MSKDGQRQKSSWMCCATLRMQSVSPTRRMSKAIDSASMKRVSKEEFATIRFQVLNLFQVWPQVRTNGRLQLVRIASENCRNGSACCQMVASRGRRASARRLQRKLDKRMFVSVLTMPLMRRIRSRTAARSVVDSALTSARRSQRPLVSCKASTPGSPRSAATTARV